MGSLYGIGIAIIFMIYEKILMPKSLGLFAIAEVWLVATLFATYGKHLFSVYYESTPTVNRGSYYAKLTMSWLAILGWMFLAIISAIPKN